MIDNVERNHKLGMIQEFNVGPGKLLICMTDLETQQEYPEARQLYRSLLSYMDSSEFSPQMTLTPAQLIELFTHQVGDSKIKELGNISYDEYRDAACCVSFPIIFIIIKQDSLS